MYIYLMKNKKELNIEVIQGHVEYIRLLKSQDKLVLCGPFTDYPGGMVIIQAKDILEATEIAKSDPYIAYGYKSFVIRTIQPANEDNNYLLDN